MIATAYDHTVTDAPTSIKTRVITDIREFEQSRDNWNSLVDDRVFHSWEWMFTWWEVWKERGQLAIAVVLDQNDRWIGVAPWYKSRESTRGCVLSNIGCGSVCSDYISIASRPGLEQAVAQQLYEITLGNRSHFSAFADVDLYEFEGHTAADEVMVAYVQRAKQENLPMEVTEVGGTWRTRLDSETWQQFEKTLSKSFRRKTKKAVQRLLSDDFDAKTLWSEEDLERHWPDFVELHQQRRHLLGQDGCFVDPQFEAFLKKATLRLANASKAQINMVFHQGQPFATCLEFNSGDSVYMYQTGMDTDKLNLEPGHLTFSWAIRESIDRTYQWFDFLRGDEPYKARWKSERTSLYRTRVVPNRWQARIRNRVWRTGRDCKHIAKTILKRRTDQKGSSSNCEEKSS